MSINNLSVKVYNFALIAKSMESSGIPAQEIIIYCTPPAQLAPLAMAGQLTAISILCRTMGKLADDSHLQQNHGGLASVPVVYTCRPINNIAFFMNKLIYVLGLTVKCRAAIVADKHGDYGMRLAEPCKLLKVCDMLLPMLEELVRCTDSLDWEPSGDDHFTSIQSVLAVTVQRIGRRSSTLHNDTNGRTH
jgi:hypothetical protein